MFCSACGNKVSPNQQFCSNCGSQILITVQPAQSASAGRISKRPFLIIGALLVIAAILALIFTNKIFISQQMLIGEWKSQDPNYLRNL
jgi:uncharacterized membrane protein YvbJ